MKGWYEALCNLVWLTQLGLSMLMPPLLCLAGCWWLTNRWGAPGWVYLPGLALGLGAGAVSFQQFSRMMLQKAKKDGKNRPVHFNRHE